MPLIGGLLESQGVSKEVGSIIVQAWRLGTQKQYKYYLQKWEQYCCERSINPISPNVGTALDFLHEFYKKDLSYSTLNTVRSALSNIVQPIDNFTFGNHPLVTRYMQGVFVNRPALRRYKQIWEVSVVLKYLRFLGDNTQLSPQDLTMKITVLLALVTGQRCQTIQVLNIEQLVRNDDMLSFHINKLLKTSRPGKHFGMIQIKAFTEDKVICPVTVLKEYVARTLPLRKNNSQLLLSYRKPHKPVSSETIGKWIKKTLSSAGIDIEVFGSHSTRSASTSAAKVGNVPISIIMDAAGWSNTKTFSKFYDKPIDNDQKENFGHSLLKIVKVD